MMRTLATLPVLGFLLLGYSLCMADLGENTDCTNPKTTIEMRRCASEKLAVAEAELKDAYAKLEFAITEPERRRLLSTAQASWGKYRDANAELEGRLYLRGTIRPQVETLCRVRMTEARARELRELLRVESGR